MPLKSEAISGGGSGSGVRSSTSLWRHCTGGTVEFVVAALRERFAVHVPRDHLHVEVHLKDDARLATGPRRSARAKKIGERLRISIASTEVLHTYDRSARIARRRGKRDGLLHGCGRSGARAQDDCEMSPPAHAEERTLSLHS